VKGSHQAGLVPDVRRADTQEAEALAVR